MIFALLLSIAVCAACVPNLGLTQKCRNLMVPSIIAEKRFTRSIIIDHHKLVDFSELLLSIEAWLFEFAGKQDTMTSFK